MRIALIGYGKMGKMIESLAIPRGHEIVLKINHSNLHEFNNDGLAKADVAIEFTGPDSAFDNVCKLLQSGTPVVSGSTGWNDRIEKAKELCREKGGSFLHASNFSIGVNIFFEINSLLAKLMHTQPAYAVSVKEIHHTEKKDAPSGTAVTLAEGILAQLGRKKSWVKESANNDNELPVYSERIDPAPGTHHVLYHSEVDDIEIVHTAHNRKGFALGAIQAAEFIHDKKGVFTMKDVLGL